MSRSRCDLRTAIAACLLASALLAGCGADAFDTAPTDAYGAFSGSDLYAGIIEGGLADHVQDPADRRLLSTAIATGYILGVADAGRGTAWCPPSTLPMAQLSEHVLESLSRRSDADRARPASDLVTEALADAYPCAARADGRP